MLGVWRGDGELRRQRSLIFHVLCFDGGLECKCIVSMSGRQREFLLSMFNYFIKGAKAEPAIQVCSLHSLEFALLDNESGVVWFRIEAPE